MPEPILLSSSFTLRDLIGPFSSIAVVGNAPRLLAREHGVEIDAHDAVVRINDGRTAGFERHAGARTSARFVGAPLKPRLQGFFRTLDEPSLLITRVENQTVLDAIGWSGRAAYVRRYGRLIREAFPKLATAIDIPELPTGHPRTGLLILSLLVDAFREGVRVSLYGMETAPRLEGPEHFYEDGRAFAATMKDHEKYHCAIRHEFDALSKLSRLGYVRIP